MLMDLTLYTLLSLIWKFYLLECICVILTKCFNSDFKISGGAQGEIFKGKFLVLLLEEVFWSKLLCVSHFITAMSPYGLRHEKLHCLKLKLIDGLVYSSLDILKAFEKLDGFPSKYVFLDLMELYRKGSSRNLVKIVGVSEVSSYYQTHNFW